MTERLMEGLYRISVPLPGNPLKELNSYLLREEGRSLLIDTGFRQDACRRALEEGLAELGVDRNEMDIFLTHLHGDHSGLAPDLIAPGRSIYISAVDRRWLEDPADVAEHWQAFHLRYLTAGVPGEVIGAMNDANPAVQLAPRLGCTQYRSVENGDIFDIGEYRLECMLTPGHTPGHMCLWDAEKGLLFSGDHILFDITPNITIWPEVENSLGDYLCSLGKIRTLPVQCTLPSHRATGDFQARVDALIAHHDARLEEVVSIVAAKAGQTAYEIAAQMTWRIRAKNWEEFPEGQKFFAIGECLAHLDHLCGQGRIRARENDGIFQYEV